MSDPLERFEKFLLSHPPLDTREGPSVEWRALPPMVQIYRDMLKPSGLPPLQTAFAERVALDAERQDPGALPKAGVYARACRTYMSLVRQHHLAVALEHRSQLEAVHWIPWLDYLGIDLLTLHRSYAVGVALSVNTAGSEFWQRVKRERHPQPVGLVMLNLDVEPHANQIGQFWLHPATDVGLVIKAMSDLIMGERTGALLNQSEAYELLQSLKVRNEIRRKTSYKDDIWPFVVAYNALVQRRAWGRDPVQLGLPMATDEQITA